VYYGQHPESTESRDGAILVNDSLLSGDDPAERLVWKWASGKTLGGSAWVLDRDTQHRNTALLVIAIPFGKLLVPTG
jgi:hypothetical protein